jgi:hypothetical protein
MENGCKFESVDSELIFNYQLYPILANHYELSWALSQKIEALVHRTEIQARDIFDIFHLLGIGAKSSAISDDLRALLGDAIENTMFISYSNYKSQVVSYLKEEYQNFFGSESKWNEMQERAIQVFEQAKKGPL